MAGGIFTDRPFELNPKCLAISTAAALVFWLAPRTAVMLPILFIFVYVLIAWYDYAYNCSTPLASGRSSPQAIVDSIFKPDVPGVYASAPALAGSSARPYLPAAESDRLKLRNTYLFHVLVASPVLLWVGLRGKNAGDTAFTLAAALGVGAAAYHGAKLAGASLLA